MSRQTTKKLFGGAESDRKRGDDEATERDVILVRFGTDEAFVRFGGIAMRKFAVLRITVLPVGQTFRV